jgi:hypothetical protein
MVEGRVGIAGLRSLFGSFFEVLRLAWDFACFTLGGRKDGEDPTSLALSQEGIAVSTIDNKITWYFCGSDGRYMLIIHLVVIMLFLGWPHSP